MKYKRLNYYPATTKSSYYSGSLFEIAKIVAVSKISKDSMFAVVTDISPFHPVNYSWEDQPSDSGRMIIEDRSIDIVKTVISASDRYSNEIVYHHDIKGFIQDRNPGNIDFGIAHFIFTDDSILTKSGAMISLEVNQLYRNKLSLAHSACHLMALALNKVTAEYWKKNIANDSLGNPDLDNLAIVRSKITALSSKDIFRLGKSIRKKGLDTQSILSDINQLAEKIEKTVNQWILSGGEITLSSNNDNVISKKTWHCRIEGKEVSIPCGGTHVKNISEIKRVKVEAEKSLAQPEITLYTSVWHE